MTNVQNNIRIKTAVLDALNKYYSNLGYLKPGEKVNLALMTFLSEKLPEKGRNGQMQTWTRNLPKAVGG